MELACKWNMTFLNSFLTFLNLVPSLLSHPCRKDESDTFSGVCDYQVCLPQRKTQGQVLPYKSDGGSRCTS